MPILPDLANISNEYDKLDVLYQLQDILNAYVIKNILLVGTSSQAVVETFVNPDLYRIAVTYYQDADLWTVIANANNLTDFRLTGIYTLLIPPRPSVPSGGILTPPAN